MNDDLIFDDDDFGFEDVPQQQEEQPDNQPEQSQDDLTTEVLRLKGIADPSKIKFEDESGTVVERSWDSLSREEQLNILADSIEVEKDDLTDNERALINTLRENGMSFDEYVQSLIPVQQPTYKVDELTDEEVYALDLLEKVGTDNITDDEITEVINAAKQNEAVFKKTVEGLRKQYIQLQKDEEEQMAQQQAAQQQAAYQQFATSIQTEIGNLNKFAGQDLELSNEDVEALSRFMLEIDDNGVSEFGKRLQDPAVFTEAAFWVLNKEQIIEELTKQIQESYNRGFNAAKNEKQTTVVKNPFKKSANEMFDDDDW